MSPDAISDMAHPRPGIVNTNIPSPSDAVSSIRKGKRFTITRGIQSECGVIVLEDCAASLYRLSPGASNKVAEATHEDRQSDRPHVGGGISIFTSPCKYLLDNPVHFLCGVHLAE